MSKNDVLEWTKFFMYKYFSKTLLRGTDDVIHVIQKNYINLFIL